MEHPRYHSLTAGCVCAGRMEGDIEAAKRREADYKNRESRRASFFKKKWKHSKKGFFSYAHFAGNYFFVFFTSLCFFDSAHFSL